MNLTNGAGTEQWLEASKHLHLMAYIPGAYPPQLTEALVRKVSRRVRPAEPGQAPSEPSAVRRRSGPSGTK